MVHTITLNPSLDYTVKMQNFEIGKVNRSENEKISPGGKGINVSIVLNNLGVNSRALGYIAGFTGDEIEKRVREYGFDCDFIKLPNRLSRINIKLSNDHETEINGQGPAVEEWEIQALYSKLETIHDGDIVVLAGNIPNTLQQNTYGMIMERLKAKNIKVIVDATRDQLLSVLKYNPFLIKPNNYELEEIFNTSFRNVDEIIQYGKKLQNIGAENVIVSMAGAGAILITSGRVFKSKAPKGIVKNSVGAGDSMIAGFIAGYLMNNNLKEAFKMGVAAGSATAFSEELASKEKVEELLIQLSDLQVQSLDSDLLCL